MRYSKLIKLSVVGLSLLLIPRRSSVKADLPSSKDMNTHNKKELPVDRAS